MRRYAAGIDLGTACTKVIIIDSDGEVLARSLEKTGFQPDRAAARCLADALAAAGLAQGDLSAVISTGFARHLASMRQRAVTELTAATHGARLLFPAAGSVLDLGGQTIKACRFDERARILAFRLNEKCASGTGAFLERTARIMGVGLDQVDALARQSLHPAPISSVCAVFAESEIISQLMQAVPPQDIMQGALVACVDRALQILRQAGLQDELVLAGGVLRFSTAAELLQQKLGNRVRLPADGMRQFVAALGAARIGIRFGTEINS